METAFACWHTLFHPAVTRNIFPACWKGVCLREEKEIGPLYYKLGRNWAKRPEINTASTSFFYTTPRQVHIVCVMCVSVFCVIFAPWRRWRHRERKIEPRAKSDEGDAPVKTVSDIESGAGAHTPEICRRKQVCFVLRAGRGARDPTHARADLFVYAHRKSLSATLEISSSREEALFILQSNSSFL
jgi:hypothetical protein